MSDITLCLITKGRPDFLQQLLESFDRVLIHDNVKVLVILNGVEPRIRNEFYSWGETHFGRVDLVSFDENDAGISRLWGEIISIKTEWVIFPSDDDVINGDFFGKLEFLDCDPVDVGAFATALNLIDSKGLETGLIRSPIFSSALSNVENAARAISQCPFLWPGLIIRVSALPQQIPNSRYVSDWWIGLYLIFTTEISVLESSAVFYRVHEQQESFAASLSRKNLEALTHLGSFFQSTTFSDWLSSRTSAEVIDFLHFIRKYPPLYGELKFSSELVSVITSRLIELRIESDVHRIALFTNAFAHDVLIDTAQLRFLDENRNSIDIDPNRCNFNITIDASVCLNVKSSIDLSGDLANGIPKLRVGCSHTSKSHSEIRLDCGEKYSKEDLIDQLLIKSAEFLQSQEIFQNSVSPFEYRLVKAIRMLKNRAPKFLVKFLQQGKK
jgi:hypothetical protein